MSLFGRRDHDKARTLADGTHITRQTMTVKMYRDSAGRTRSDRILRALSAGAPVPPATILISDPLAGYSYVLETARKIAHRSAIQKIPARLTADESTGSTGHSAGTRGREFPTEAQDRRSGHANHAGAHRPGTANDDHVIQPVPWGTIGTSRRFQRSGTTPN